MTELSFEAPDFDETVVDIERWNGLRSVGSLALDESLSESEIDAGPKARILTLEELANERTLLDGDTIIGLTYTQNLNQFERIICTKLVPGIAPDDLMRGISWSTFGLAEAIRPKDFSGSYRDGTAVLTSPKADQEVGTPLTKDITMTFTGKLIEGGRYRERDTNRSVTWSARRNGVGNHERVVRKIASAPQLQK